MNTVEAFGVALKNIEKANVTQEELAISCYHVDLIVRITAYFKEAATITMIFTICRILRVQPQDLITEVEGVLNSNN